MKRLNFIFVLTFILLFGPSMAYSIDENAGTSVFPFLKLFGSTKTKAMGGVCAGLSDGMYGNPATLAIQDKKITFMHYRWIEDVNFNSIDFTLPLEGKGIGASLNLIETGKQKRTTYSNPGGIGEFETDGIVGCIGYARKINERIPLGLSIKYISQKLDDKKGDGYGLDVGGLYDLDRIKFGFLIQNIGFSKVKFIEKEERLPLTTKLGVAYIKDKGTIAFDLAKPNDNSYKFYLGGEYYISCLSLRIGYNSAIDEGNGITGGFGLSLPGMTLDGSYSPTGRFGETFCFSLSLR
ncbi:MAG: PorV/PorQ family protein [bacterium]